MGPMEWAEYSWSTRGPAGRHGAGVHPSQLPVGTESDGEELMAINVVTHYQVKCDRCPTMLVQGWTPLDEPDREEWGWWRRHNNEGGWPTTQRMLCKTCMDKLELWMEGDRTIASRFYNGSDDERFLKAKEVSGFAEAVQREKEEIERNAPYNT